MEAHKELVIGLFGFGTVGEGLYKVLAKTSSLKSNYKKGLYKNMPIKKEMHRKAYLPPTAMHCF